MPVENLIPLETLGSDFDHFLKIKNNKRIFFSGRFGTGKTYFLKDFFGTHVDAYEVFHLFPINYQINSNEDIIELLKYDILVELLKKNNTLFQKNAVSGIKESSALFYSWFRDKYSLNTILQSTISYAEAFSEVSVSSIALPLNKLGKPLKDLLEMDKEFQEFKKEYIAGDKGIMDKYVEAIKPKDLSETDNLSALLSIKIKEHKGIKQSILVLDDLDRIDPEHIFRILNIFSAHFDDEGNKFGFDAVIIVGDIQNIKSIFHHKFGKDTDFVGYFDKFFTVEPYLLSNRRIIAERIPHLVKQIQHEEQQLEGAIGESGYMKLLLADVLNRALELGKLNLRQLYKPINYAFPELKSGVFSNGFRRGSDIERIVDIGIKFLVAIFGSDEKVFLALLLEIQSNISDGDVGIGAPYGVYSMAMLKVLKIDMSPGKKPWRGYSLDLPTPTNGYAQLGVDGNNAQKTKLFYELLVEYVKQSKYIKNNDWEYEN